MPGTPAFLSHSRRGVPHASSKLGVCEVSRISLEILIGKTTSMIFCGMLPPLLGLEASRPDGLQGETEFGSSFDYLQLLVVSCFPPACLPSFLPSFLPLNIVSGRGKEPA